MLPINLNITNRIGAKEKIFKDGDGDSCLSPDMGEEEEEKGGRGNGLFVLYILSHSTLRKAMSGTQGRNLEAQINCST